MHNAAIYSKFKHASQTPDCDQGITSVPIGKLQLLDKFPKETYNKTHIPKRVYVPQLSSLVFSVNRNTLTRLTEFGYTRAETLLKC